MQRQIFCGYSAKKLWVKQLSVIIDVAVVFTIKLYLENKAAISFT